LGSIEELFTAKVAKVAQRPRKKADRIKYSGGLREESFGRFDAIGGFATFLPEAESMRCH
jgi:hypothetical protein